MSASMVRKSLEIVDLDFSVNKGKKDKEKKNSTKRLNSQDCKIRKSQKKGRQEPTITLPTKTTLAEARKNQKRKEETLKRNLAKLKLIEEACSIKLDPIVTKQLFKRAITKAPVSGKRKSKESKKTAFTEEDFAAFEADYVDE